MVATDIHQHLWPEALVEALARRRSPPCIRRSGRRSLLAVRDEPEHDVDVRDHDPDARRALLRRDGIDRALICLSSPLGIGALPRAEAEPLVDAYNTGVLALGAPFGAWGALALAPPDPDDVDALVDAGAIGISLPAGAISGPSGLERCCAVLARLEQRGVPLLVHPGPGPSPAAWTTASEPGVPVWWPAMTRYVADMNAAWHAFAAWGRERHPSLRVVFPMLAGLAPLHAERLASRGGPTEAIADDRIYYDTSSYGIRAVDALVRCVGVDQLVYGSDRPVVDALAAAARRRGAAGDGRRQRRPPPERGRRAREAGRMTAPRRSRDLARDELRELVVDLAGATRAVATSRAPRPDRAHLRAAAARRARRRLADLLAGRPRHGLSRPRGRAGGAYDDPPARAHAGLTT